jgi:hypothetical protein
MTTPITVNSLSSLVADNVIPVHSKVISSSMSEEYQPVRFDAEQVNLFDAAGGFSSVLQLATDYCLFVFDYDLQDSIMIMSVHVSQEELRTFLINETAPFASDHLNRLKAKALSSLRLDPLLYLVFQPRDLHFGADRKVFIRYKVYLVTGKIKTIEPPETEIPPFTPPDPEVVFSPSAPFTLGQPFRDLARSSRRISVLKTGIAAGSLAMRELTEPDITYPSDMVLAAALSGLRIEEIIGSFYLNISSSYFIETDTRLKHVDVYADLTTANVTYDIPQGDIKRLYDQFFFGNNGADITAFLLRKSRVHLTPTVSLVGRNAVDVAVSEIGSLDVSVFPVEAGRQALAIAFDLKPGYRGIAEEVQHFIGFHDYGVISDEFLVEKLFKYKWRLGFFKQALPLSAPIKVRRDGVDEDATVQGVIRLDSLDIVSIDMDSNRRTDGIKLIGRGKMVPEYIRLLDGRRIGPGEVNLGGERDINWGIFTIPEIDPMPPIDPVMRDFSFTAYRGAYRHMVRPFARFPDEELFEILYSRTEGVTRQIYAVGNISDVFI